MAWYGRAVWNGFRHCSLSELISVPVTQGVEIMLDREWFLVVMPSVNNNGADAFLYFLPFPMRNVIPLLKN